MKTTASSISAASILILLIVTATSSAEIIAIDESLNPTIISKDIFQNSTESRYNSTTSYNNTTARSNDYPLPLNSTSGNLNSTTLNATRVYGNSVNSTQQQYTKYWNGTHWNQSSSQSNGTLLSNGTSNFPQNQTSKNITGLNNKTKSSGAYHGYDNDYDYTSNNYEHSYTTSDSFAILTFVGVIFRLVVLGAGIFVIVKYCKNRRERLRNTQFVLNQINNPQQIQYIPQQNYQYSQYPVVPQQQTVPVGYVQNPNPTQIIVPVGGIVAQNIPQQQPQTMQYQQL